MPLIEDFIIINKKRAGIYNLVRNIEEFPKFMKDVKRIQVIKRLPHRLVVNWEVKIDGAHITWEEEDLFDSINYVIRFKMLEGDYSKYEGEWRFISVMNKTKVILSVNIEWGAPAFVEFPEVKKILMRKTRKSIRLMLLAIKRKMG